MSITPQTAPANATTALDAFFENVLGYCHGSGQNGSCIVTVAQLHQALSILIQQPPLNDPPLTPIE